MLDVERNIEDSQAALNELDVAFIDHDPEMSVPVPVTKDEFKLSISQQLRF
jgi:hypothetical protein